jgi:hypothetical protein
VSFIFQGFFYGFEFRKPGDELSQDIFLISRKGIELGIDFIFPPS